MQTWVNGETGETGFSLDSYARDRSVEFEDNYVGEAENKTWFELAFAVRACLFDHVFDGDLCTEKVFFGGRFRKDGTSGDSVRSEIVMWKQDQYFDDGSAAIFVSDVSDLDDGVDVVLTVDAACEWVDGLVIR